MLRASWPTPRLGVLVAETEAVAEAELPVVGVAVAELEATAAVAEPEEAAEAVLRWAAEP